MFFSAKNIAPMFALALSASLFSGHAMAAKQVDGAITLSGFELIDLNSNDGIAPELSVKYNYVYGSAYHSNQFSNDYQSDAHPNGEPLMFFSHIPGMSYSTSVSGNFMTNIEFQGDSTIHGNFGSYMTSESLFRLSPHTEMVLTGNMRGSINSDNGDYKQGQNGGTGAWINITYDFVEGPYVMAHASLQDGVPHSYNQDFTLHFRNDSDETIDGHLKAMQWANATDVAAVPEPETYAMMLAGLGALAAVARRRRRA